MLLGFVPLTLAIAMGPSVAVQVTADEAGTLRERRVARSLRGWLVQRLIEEGFTIAPVERADRVVTLSPDEGSVAVESSGHRFVVDEGPAAVMRLEALHRTRMVLEHAETAQPEPPVSAVLGFRTVTQAPEGAAGDLESALLVEGYVLTPHPRPTDPVLCVEHSDEMLAVAITEGANACPDPTVRLRYQAIREPGGVQPIIDLVESLSEQPPPAVPARRSRTTPTPPPVEPAESSGRRRRWSSKDAEFRLGVDGGIAVRGAVDPAARASMRVGLSPGPGAQLHVSIIPAREGDVRTVDTVLAAGPDLRLGRKRFGFGAGLVAGALVHAYQYDTARGGSVDWYVGLPTSVSFGKPGAGARVHLFTEVFVVGNRLEHVRDNAPDWTRTAWGLRAGLGFTYGWEIL